MPQWALLIRPVAHMRRRHGPRGWRGGLDGVGCRRCAWRSCGRGCHNCAVCAASGNNNNNNNNKDHLDCLICYVCLWCCLCVHVSVLVCVFASVYVCVCLPRWFVCAPKVISCCRRVHKGAYASFPLSPQTQLSVMKIFSIRQRQT